MNTRENKVTISELNAFLKGQYMGIHGYENLIQKEKDINVKKQLQEIQNDHKLHAARVAKRIQDLGGRPVDDEGFVGSIQENLVRVFGTPKDTKDIIKSAIKGESDYGIKISEEIVRGDLDPESMQLVREILDKDRIHVTTLNNMLQ